MSAGVDGLGGPVSAALEADLRSWVQRRGIVLWLDASEHYSGFVDRLRAMQRAGGVPYEVRAFRGSHLELMLELETLAGGVEKSQLVVHLPRLNEETIRSTPLLELYVAGARYRKKLDTLITEAAAGRVRGEQIDAFKAQDGLSLDRADAWLAGLLDDNEGGLGAQLRAMSLSSVVDGLLSAGFVARRLGNADDEAVIWERLDAWTGLHAAWRDASLPRGTLPSGRCRLCGVELGALRRIHRRSQASVHEPATPACERPAAKRRRRLQRAGQTLA